MPHFYFDLVNDEPVFDRHGIQLPDVAAARAHAQKMADELKRSGDRTSRTSFTKITVKDSKFNVVLSVPVDGET
jgi:hypothetical protein